MDRNFKKSLDMVLRHEGGFVNLRSDPGGPTNKGITLATFRRFIKPNGSIDDLKKLTIEQAATCYRMQYWDAVAGAQLPDGVDYAVFDFAVNSGPGRAAKALQKVVGTTQDGKIGPATLKAVRSMAHASLINKLCDDRMAFLKRLKTWPTFGKGWSRRVTDVRSEALALAARPSPENPSIVTREVEVEVEKPVVPKSVEKEVAKKSDRWSWLTGLFGSGAISLGWLAGMDWQAVLAGGVVLLVFVLVLIVLRHQIIGAVKDIRASVE